MKIHTCLLLWLICFVIIGWQSPLAFAETSLSVGVRYDMFTDDRSPEGSGTEFTIPFGAVSRQERWVLQIGSAYSLATVDPGAEADSELSSLTDTFLSGSYLFPDWPVGIIIGIDLNLPTGKEQLKRNEQAAEAGERHDLFEVDDFGEGFNAGVSLGLVKELGSLNLGLTGAYIFTGEYDPTDEVADDEIDPSDQVVVSSALKWKAASGLEVESTIAYSHFLAEQTNGKDSYQEGAKMTFGGHVRLQRHPLDLVLGVHRMVQAKSKEIMGDTLKTESENSNGAELFGWVDLLYRMSPKLDLQILGDIRQYGESDRTNTITGVPFQGRRLRYAAGPGITYLLNDNLAWNAVAKYFVMEQEHDMTQDQDVTFQGMNISIGMTYTF